MTDPSTRICPAADWIAGISANREQLIKSIYLRPPGDMTLAEKRFMRAPWQVSLHRRAGQTLRIGLDKIRVANNAVQIPIFADCPESFTSGWATQVEDRRRASAIQQLRSDSLRRLLWDHPDFGPMRCACRLSIFTQEFFYAAVVALELFADADEVPDARDVTARIMAGMRLFTVKTKFGRTICELHGAKLMGLIPDA